MHSPEEPSPNRIADTVEPASEQDIAVMELLAHDVLAGASYQTLLGYDMTTDSGARLSLRTYAFETAPLGATGTGVIISNRAKPDGVFALWFNYCDGLLHRPVYVDGEAIADAKWLLKDLIASGQSDDTETALMQDVNDILMNIVSGGSLLELVRKPGSPDLVNPGAYIADKVRALVAQKADLSMLYRDYGTTLADGRKISINYVEPTQAYGVALNDRIRPTLKINLHDNDKLERLSYVQQGSGPPRLRWASTRPVQASPADLHPDNDFGEIAALNRQLGVPAPRQNDVAEITEILVSLAIGNVRDLNTLDSWYLKE